MESEENDRAVSLPSHKPWKSIKPIPTFPPPRRPRGEIKSSKPAQLRATHSEGKVIALDDIPVQCKNYHGIVTSLGPIDDLERCIRNTGGTLALLFILGELSNEFRGNLQKRQEKLSRELGREISFEVIDQDRIAELYVCYISQRLGGRPGPADSATD
jgi:hypothetical protein